MAVLASFVNGMVAGSIHSPCRAHSSAIASASARVGGLSTALFGVLMLRPSRRISNVSPRGWLRASL
jgi:hypothetical protein